MIRFEQVGKRYANGHVGLHELSFRVRRGEFLFVTGHSGAGKSTLLRLLLAMERPTSGKLLLAGQADFIMSYDLAVLSAVEKGFPAVTVAPPMSATPMPDGPFDQAKK